MSQIQFKRIVRKILLGLVLALFFISPFSKLSAFPRWVIQGSPKDCAGLLSAIRYQHSIPEVSDESTDKAKNAIRRFRLQELGKFTAHPSLKPVIGDSEQTRNHNAIADRIRGIEEQYEDLQKGDQSNAVIVGSIFEGRDKIEDFLRKAKSGKKNYEEIANGMKVFKQVRFINLFYLAVTGFFTYAGPVVFLSPKSNIISDSVMLGAILGDVYLAIQRTTSILQQFSTFISNRFGRMIPSDHFFSEQPRKWAYISRDLRLSDYLVDEIWKNGNALEPGVVAQEIHSIATPSSRVISIDGQKWTKELKEEVFKNSAVSVDLLYSTNPEGKEKLIVFLRFKHKRNFPPGREKDNEWIRRVLLQLLGQPQPT